MLAWVLGVLAWGARPVAMGIGWAGDGHGVSMGWAWDGDEVGMGVEGSVQPRLRGAARGVGGLEAVEPVLGRDQVVSREIICSRGRGG